MSNLTKRLLELIQQEKTVNEIAHELQLSNKQIYNILTVLEHKGIGMDRKYFSNGDILYLPQKMIDIKEPIFPKEHALITPLEETELQAVVLSDLHLASVNDRVDLLDKVYEYCAKNNIHLIFHCGDMIDGNIGGPKKFNRMMDQIDYFLKVYPFDDHILNVTILGNHDYSALQKEGINLDKVIYSYRHDILSLGYRLGKLNIKNDFILFAHTVNDIQSLELNHFLNQKRIILEGHHHFMLVQEKGNSLTVQVPAMVQMRPSLQTPPSFLKMTLRFMGKTGYIHTGIFEQMLLEPEIVRINQLNCNLYQGKPTQICEVENIEIRNKKKVKVKTGLERFQNKYGNML